MKLVQEIKKNELLGNSWGIYELNPDEKKKYGNNYALSQGVFSDYAIKEFGADDLLSNLKDFAFIIWVDIEHRLIFIQRISTYLIQEKKQRIMSWNG